MGNRIEIIVGGGVQKQFYLFDFPIFSSRLINHGTAGNSAGTLLYDITIMTIWYREQRTRLKYPVSFRPLAVYRPPMSPAILIIMTTRTVNRQLSGNPVSAATVNLLVPIVTGADPELKFVGGQVVKT